MALAESARLSPLRPVSREVEGDCLRAVPKLAAYGGDASHSIPSTLLPSCLSPFSHHSTVRGDGLLMVRS
jgi:hypothetical protein